MVLGFDDILDVSDSSRDPPPFDGSRDVEAVVYFGFVGIDTTCDCEFDLFLPNAAVDDLASTEEVLELNPPFPLLLLDRGNLLDIFVPFFKLCEFLIYINPLFFVSKLGNGCWCCCSEKDVDDFGTVVCSEFCFRR